jgi:hypothetical protein
VKFERLIARDVRGFWATSYSFSLKLFDQYLLRKLSQSTLNAVVMTDHDKAAEVWEHLPANERYLARRVGSRYLLRGIQVPGGGAFHPKTYLLVRASDATLIVGSGNLTRDGIDGGHEVFTSFSTNREADMPSLRAWAGWMSRVVQAHDDALLRERWAALRDVCPWMLGNNEGTAFLVNDERGLLEQLTDRLPGTVSELHVTAPFFDRHARALADLITVTDPELVTLYAGAGMKVDGLSLAAVLANAWSVRVLSYEPRTFVHAKLIGAISNNGQGTLLVGSPNLSQSALTLTSTEKHGNSEAAVIRHGSADQLRAVFNGSGLKLVDRPLSSLNALEFEDEYPTVVRPLILQNATWLTDGRLTLRWSGKHNLPDDASVVWDEHVPGVLLGEGGVTAERIDARDPLPLLCWLADSEGNALSNRVPIDDPTALRESLTGSDRKSSSRPRELEGMEMIPLVRLVLWAHDRFIFDLGESAAIRHANDAAAENADDDDASDFWDKYAQAELEYDVRTHAYRPLTSGSSGHAGPVDELLRELQVLLHAAPDAPHPVLHVLSVSVDNAEGEDESSPGMPWTMEARQRIRAYNLLSRWCDAVADPRHALISPDAPIINYQTLLAVLLLAWVHKALDEDHLCQLLLKLTKAFIGTADGQGFLGRADEELRAAAIERLHGFTAEAAAGMVASALGPGTPWREEIYDWQPILRRGIAHRVLVAGDWSATVVEWLTDETTTSSKVHELLLKRLNYIDDRTWCARLAAELELKSIEIDLHRQAKVTSAISVQGPTDPLHDGRLLTVARRVIDHKGLIAVAIMCGDITMVFEPGKQARALVSGNTLRSCGPTDTTRFKEIEQQGGSWADVLDISVSRTA